MEKSNNTYFCNLSCSLSSPVSHFQSIFTFPFLFDSSNRFCLWATLYKRKQSCTDTARAPFEMDESLVTTSSPVMVPVVIVQCCRQQGQ